MGTHPISESDFDCLTEKKCFGKDLDDFLTDLANQNLANLDLTLMKHRKCHGRITLCQHTFGGRLLTGEFQLRQLPIVKKTPEIISPGMTQALIIYSVLF